MDFKIIIHSETEKNNLSLKGKSDQNLLLTLLAKKIKIDHSCGGNGTCGTCKFRLLQGELSPRTLEELELFTDRNLNPDERLACQSKPLSDLVIKITN